MAYRSNAANSWSYYRHFGKETALAEFFKTTKLVYMKSCILHPSIVAQFECDPGVSFDSGDWIDCDLSHFSACLSRSTARGRSEAPSGRKRSGQRMVGN